MTNAITSFLKAKDTEEYKSNNDKFFDHQMELMVEGKQKILYIQDITRSFNSRTHTMEIVLLDKDYGNIYVVTKTCIAPPDCEINWDTLHCATTISLL